jgi:hypothetical protein
METLSVVRTDHHPKLYEYSIDSLRHSIDLAPESNHRVMVYHAEQRIRPIRLVTILCHILVHGLILAIHDYNFEMIRPVR